MIRFILCILVFKLHWRHYIESSYNAEDVHMKTQRSSVGAWAFCPQHHAHLLLSSSMAPRVAMYQRQLWGLLKIQIF